MYVVSSFNQFNTAAQVKLKLELRWGWIENCFVLFADFET